MNIIQLKIGDQYDLNVQLPGKAVDEGVIYVSSDDQVMPVSATGVVEAIDGTRDGQVVVVKAFNPNGVEVASYMFVIVNPLAVLEKVVKTPPVISLASEVTPVGIADAGSMVELLKEDGSQIGSALVGENGQFSFPRVSFERVKIRRVRGGQTETVTLNLRGRIDDQIAGT